MEPLMVAFLALTVFLASVFLGIALAEAYRLQPQRERADAERNGLRSSLLSQIHDLEGQLKAKDAAYSKLYRALLKANQKARALRAELVRGRASGQAKRRRA